MTKTHLIYCPFTGVGTNKILTDDWLKDRIEIFKNYTLKSLLNQTNKDFILWLSFRSEEETNVLVKELFEYLRSFEFRNCFSFGGLMYWDDKNAKANETLKERLQVVLLELSAGIGLIEKEEGKADYIYLTRIDSDDMFHKDVVQLIQDQEPEVEYNDSWPSDIDLMEYKALTLQNGYVYNKDTQEVAEWNPLTNPPFHTIIFPRDVFFDAQKHIDWYEGFKSHEDIARLPHKVLWRGDNRLDRLYMVFTHNPKMHISTNFNHPFKGKLVNIDLSEFGI